MTAPGPSAAPAAEAGVATRGSAPARAARAPAGGGAAPAAAGGEGAPWRGWGPALPVLGAGLLLLGALFGAEVAAAVRTWTTSAAYNHGWLVLPIALWLGWTRRDRLAALPPRPAPALALLALPAGLAWLAAERMGIMEGRQFAALGALYALLLATLGWRVCRAVAAPLAYLVFLVPFGAFAVPLLQAVTARLVEFGLSLTAIPHYVDALVIEIPEGTFHVAEACAGLRFAVASLAFGALYALVMFRSPGRRLAVMALALAVPVLANGLRAFGLVVLGHLQGSAAAVEADHVLYGWVFFSLVILLLTLAGLPFREDGPAPAMGGAPGPRVPAPRPATRSGIVAAAGLAVAVAASGPIAAALLDRGTGEPRPIAARLLAQPPCAAAGEGGLECSGAAVSARLLAFPAGTNWDAVAAERRRALGGSGDEDVTFEVPVPGGAWRVRQPPDGSGLSAAAVWLDGRPAGDGLRSRAAQALRALGGGAAGRPVLAAVALRAEGAAGERMDPARQRALLRALLEGQGESLAARAAALSAGEGP